MRYAALHPAYTRCDMLHSISHYTAYSACPAAARRQAPLCGETSASPSRQGLLRARPRVYSHPQSPQSHVRIHPIRLCLAIPRAPEGERLRTRGMLCTASCSRCLAVLRIPYLRTIACHAAWQQCVCDGVARGMLCTARLGSTPCRR